MNPYQSEIDSLKNLYRPALEQVFATVRTGLSQRIESSSLPLRPPVWDDALWQSALDQEMQIAVEQALTEAMEFWVENWGLEAWPSFDPEGVDRVFDDAARQIGSRFSAYSEFISKDVLSSIARFPQDRDAAKESIGLVAVGGSLYDSRVEQLSAAEANYTFFAAAASVSRGTSYEPDKVWGCSFSNSRVAHEEADGQRRQFNAFFDVDGETGSWPGDFSAKNSINCACFVEYIDDPSQRDLIIAGWNEEEPEPGMTIEVGDVADLSDVENVFDFFEFSSDRHITMNMPEGRIVYETRWDSGPEFVTPLGVDPARSAALLKMFSSDLGSRIPESLEFSQPDFSDGIIFSLEPDDETRALIGEVAEVDADSLHLTIAYYGKREDGAVVGPGAEGGARFEEDFRDVLLQVGLAVAETFPDGLQVSKISGSGAFYDDDGDLSCHVALVDGVDLPGLRERVVKFSKEYGIPPSEAHGFTPHITLSWSGIPDVEPLIGVELAFNSLSARFGTELLSFPFGSSNNQGPTEASTMTDKTDVTILDTVLPVAPVLDEEVFASGILSSTIEIPAMTTTNNFNVYGGGLKIAEDGTVEILAAEELAAAAAPVEVELQNSLPEGGRMPAPESVVPAIVTPAPADNAELAAEEETETPAPEETAEIEEGAELAEDDAAVQPLARVVNETPSFAPSPSSKVLDGAPKASEETAVLEADVEAPVEFMEENGSKDGAEWKGVIIVEGIESGDGRKIQENGLTWRDLPLPLMLQVENQPGHSGSVIAGSITHLERVGQDIVGYGKFDSGEAGTEARRLLGEGTMRGVSADIDMAEIEWEIPESEIPDGDVTEDELLDLLYDDRAIMVLTEGRIMGATLTPFPAFQEAYVEVLEVESGDEEGLVASGGPAQYVWRQHGATSFTTPDKEARAMVASAGAGTLRQHIPEVPPADWFSQAASEGAYPVTVEVNGQIHGYAAQWGSCHIGFADHCEPVPASSCAYAMFRTGNTQVRTQEGDRLVATGPIFADTFHPDLYASASDAYAHYADTGTAVADVAVFEDAHGIQIRGAVRPSATSDQIRALRGADISPDWRPDQYGHLECVALLAVNCSGFLVPGLVASAGRARGSFDVKAGSVLGLTGAGMLKKGSHKFDTLQRQIVEMNTVVKQMAAKEKERELAARRAAVLADLGIDQASVEAPVEAAVETPACGAEECSCEGACSVES